MHPIKPRVLRVGSRNWYNGVDLGMTGFDGGSWSQAASREAPNPKTQRKNTSANRTSYSALPLAA